MHGKANKVQWVFQDLIFLREAGIRVDPDLFKSILKYENKNYNFAPCECGARSLEQHHMECPWSSVLWEWGINA